MKNIFIGMILVFINFNLYIGHSRIGLIPTFLGYIFMLNGLSELTELSPKFSKVIPFCKGMLVYSVIVYALELFGLSSAISAPIGIVLGLVSTIVSLYISHGIIMGIMDIEAIKLQDLNSKQLYSTWKLLAIFSFAVYALLIIPVLAIVGVIITFVISVYYLFIFHKTKKLFYGEYSSV